MWVWANALVSFEADNLFVWCSFNSALNFSQEFPDAVSKKLYNIASEILTTERA